MHEEYHDYDLVVAQMNGRPYEQRVIDKQFYKLIEAYSLRPVVFHSLRHSSTSLKSEGTLRPFKGIQVMRKPVWLQIPMLMDLMLTAN